MWRYRNNCFIIKYLIIIILSFSSGCMTYAQHKQQKQFIKERNEQELQKQWKHEERDEEKEWLQKVREQQQREEKGNISILEIGIG